MVDPLPTFPEKAKLNDINQYLACLLCKGYLIDATTITECLHSFCRSCIIKFLEDNSHCPVCQLTINKAKPNLKLDKTLQDIVYKLVPDLFLKEMTRRKLFYRPYPQLALRVSPEERGEDCERTIFNAQEKISLSLEYICSDSSPGAIKLPGLMKSDSSQVDNDEDTQMKRYLLCPGMCRIDVLKKFVRNKYNVDTSQFYIDVLYKRIPLPDHYTLIDVAYIYSWQRNETMKFFFRIMDINKASKRFDLIDVSQVAPQPLLKPLTKTKSNGEKNSPSKRRGSISNQKPVLKLNLRTSASPERVEKEKSVACDAKNLSPRKNFEVKSELESDIIISKCNETGEILNKIERDSKTPDECRVKLDKSSPIEHNNKENDCSNVELNSDSDNCKNSEECKGVVNDIKCHKGEMMPKPGTIKIKKERLSSDQIESLDVENKLNNGYSTPTVEAKTSIKNCKNSEVPIDFKTKTIKSEPQSPEKDKTKSPKRKSNSPKSKSVAPKSKKDSHKLKLKIIVQEPQSAFEDPYNFDSNEFFEQQNNPNNIICKPNCYTKITLNRTNNVEIITKVQTMPFNNKTGQDSKSPAIQYTAKKQNKKMSLNPLIKKATKAKKSPKSSPSKKTPNKNLKNLKVPKIILSKRCVNGKKDFKISPAKSKSDIDHKPTIEDEKISFLKIFNLQAKPVLVTNIKTEKQDVVSDTKLQVVSKPVGGQKRKNRSPMKARPAKSLKFDNETSSETSKKEPHSLNPNQDTFNSNLVKEENKTAKPVKIIFQQKLRTENLEKPDSGLRSFISNCKIPSSLSITIKESSEPTLQTPVAPPVKNFIEILKISDDGSKKSEAQTIESAKDLPQILEDTEIQVDKDLNEIAKSLTEKIPMSTTISHIIGPKQSISIPIKSTFPKLNIEPAPVPEVPKVWDESAKNSDLTNSFQKAFEEYSKNGRCFQVQKKRSPLKINPLPVKKPKVKDDFLQFPSKKDDVPLPKVAIPRLPHQRNLKLPTSPNPMTPMTMASLHSSSLGMNYTVSVDQTSPSKTNKVNGTVSPKKVEIISDVKISSKTSPNSLPVVKKMFLSQKLANISPKPPSTSVPSGSKSPKSPNLVLPTPESPNLVLATPESPNLLLSTSENPNLVLSTPETNVTVAMNPNELLEKINLQNLAQLTATFNFNPALLALSQANQMAAFQQAMLLKQFELQNSQSWLVRNQGPLLQYENYLKSLSGVKED